MSQQQPFRFFERSDRLLSLNGRKIFQKIPERVASLEVINEVLRRYARANEYRGTTEYLRIALYDALSHRLFQPLPREPYSQAANARHSAAR